MIISLDERKRAKEFKERLKKARPDKLIKGEKFAKVWHKVVFDDIDSYNEEE